MWLVEEVVLVRRRKKKSSWLADRTKCKSKVVIRRKKK